MLDAAYGKRADLALQRVDLIIGLDLPRWLSFGRLLGRLWHAHPEFPETVLLRSPAEVERRLASLDARGIAPPR